MAFTSEAAGLLRVDVVRQCHDSVDDAAVARVPRDLLARQLPVATRQE
jgi:hypothetical protein